MEHLNTLQTKKSQPADRSRWRLWCMMLMALFMTTVAGYGQIAWQPGIDLNLVKSGLDEGEKLDVYFTASSAIASGTVKITLPKGITTTQSSGIYEGASVSSNYEIVSVSTSGDLTIVTCNIKNSLGVNEEVHFQLPVWASCNAVDGKIQMQVQNAGTNIGDYADRNVIIEELDVTAVLNVPSETDWADSEKSFAQKLTVTSLNGHIASLIIQLKADATFDLKKFQLNGSDLTTQVSAKDANNTYTITLSDLNLTTAVLTFSSVHPAVVGLRSLSAVVIAACDAKPIIQPTIEFTVPGDAGTPQMDYIGTSYVSNTSGDPLVYGDGSRYLWDGETSHYMKVVYKNNGDGTAVYTKTNFLLYNTFSCIMKNEDVYYRIGGSELLSSPSSPPTKIEASGLNPANSISGYLLQPLKNDIKTHGVRSLDAELYNTPIAPGEYIAYYIPVRGGKIYATDPESLKVDAYRASIVYGLYCLRTNITAVQNAKGEAGIAEWKDSRTSRIGVPRFTEPYEALIIYESERTGSNDIQRVETVNKIRVGVISAEYGNTLRIQKPDWVNVDITGTNIQKVTDTEYKITGTLSGLTYAYDFPNTGKPLVNTIDSIRFFLDHSINTGSYQETLTSVSRVTQPIYYITTPETIELVEFKAERQEDYVGWKPADESTPLGFYSLDGTTKADNADKTIFVENDLGTMSWTARITAPTISAGQTLYLPIQFAPTAMKMKNGSGDIKILRNNIEIETGTPEYISVDNGLKGYAKYTITAALEADDIIQVNIPFTAIAMDLRGSIISECKLGTAGNVNPFTDTSLKGVDTKKISIGTYSLTGDLWGTNAATHTFSENAKKKSLSFSAYSYANNRLPSPWFPYEVRQLKYLKKLTFTAPEGYYVDPASLVLYGPGRSVADSRLTASVTPEYTESYNNGKQVLIIDVNKEFVAGRWPYPDEKFYQVLDYDLIATNEATPGNQAFYTSPTFADLRPGQTDYSFNLSHTLVYNGYVMSSSHNSTVILDDPTKTYVNISVENSTPGRTITGNWIYLEGTDFTITSAEAGGQPLKVAGNYIKLGDASSSLSIAAGKNVGVKVELNYTGTTDGQVKVHTLSGWDNASYDPSGVSDINSTTLDANRSRTSEFSLIYPSTRINGSLSVSEYVFENAGDEYTLTAKISSASSQGTLVNPIMEIKTLKGHTFIPTSGNLTYGGNTFTVTPSDFDPVMDGANVVGFTFDMRKVSGVGPGDVLFPGYTDQSAGAPQKKEAVLTLKYSIGCDASMAGVGYTGTLKGSSLSGVAVTDKTVNSQKQYPKVTLPYEFDVALTTSTGNKAFSKESATEAIQIEVKLKENPTVSVKSGDIVEIELPNFIDLNGNITWTGKVSGSLNKDDSRISNVPGSGKRVISFPLTHAAYTAKNDAVTFSLPVVYTETAANKATVAGSPISTITAKVMTIETIGLVGCPSPTAQEISAGNGTMDLAFVVSSLDEAMNIFVNGDAQALPISSQDFNGKFSLDGGTTWSANSTSTQVEDLRTSNHDNGFPTDGSGITKEILIDAEFSGSASSFGKVKFTYTLYPSLKYTLSKTVIDADCGSTKVTLDDLVTKESQYTDVFFYTDAACTSKVNGTDQEKELFSETIFYVRSENKGGKEVINPASKVTVKVNTDLGGVSVSGNTSVIIGETLTLTAAVTTPANIPSDAVYSWYKDGLFVETTAGLTYTKTISATTESGNYHLVITSPTKGLCSNVSSTVNISVTDRPANIDISSTGETIYSCDAAANLNLAGLIDNFASYINSETFHWNTTGNTTDGTAAFTSTISLAASMGMGTSHTIYVWAKNSAGNFSASSASISVTAIQYTAAALGTVTRSNVEGTAGSNVTATLSVSGTTGDKNAGDYTYRLYDTDVAAVADETNTESGNSTTFNLSLPVPSLTTSSSTGYTEYKRYVTVQGACMETTREEVSIKVYPAAEISVTTTEEKFCTTDPVLSGKKLSSYITGDAKTDWFDYTYSIAGGVTDAPLTDAVVLPTTAGTYSYTLKATNKLSGSTPATATLSIKVITPITVTIPTGTISLEHSKTATITATVTNGTATKYELYQEGSSTPVDDNTTGTFTILHTEPADITRPYESERYYIKALGAIDCADGTSSSVEVRMYPAPLLVPNQAADNAIYCEEDAHLGENGAGINLWDYFLNKNTTWFTYTYGIDEAATTEIPADGFVKLSNTPGGHEVNLKVVNKLSGSTLLPGTDKFNILVTKKTRITALTGYDVTEGDAVHIQVSAEGQSILYYEWQKWDGSNWQTIPGLTGDSETLTTSAQITENGARYRVIVSCIWAVNSCHQDTREFVLNVKSRTTPPLGNYRVSWNVIGYGKVEVTADGIAISNGSHVNKGTKLVISATTWLRNALDKVTVNETEYKSSPVTYIVGEENVDIVAEFNGPDPNPDPNSNADVENSTRIWTEGGYACIYTETASRVRIVTFNGRLVTDQKIGEGESRIQLPDGYYIVTLSDGTTKKIAIRNF